MKTSLSTKGQVVLPAEIREQDHLVPGQQFEVERIKAGQYLLKKIAGCGQKGLVQWLLDCPVKDWFQSIPSESTADLIKRIPRFDE